MPARPPAAVPAPSRRPSNPLLVIHDHMKEPDEPGSPTHANRALCDLFKSNQFRPHLCMNCQSTPRSPACVGFGKSAAEDATYAGATASDTD